MKIFFTVLASFSVMCNLTGDLDPDLLSAYYGKRLLKKTYDVRVVTGFFHPAVCSGHQPITASVAQLSDAAAAIKALVSAADLYPMGTLKHLITKKIYICSGILQDGRCCAAITGFGGGLLYLGADDIGSGTMALEQDVHHEFFHMIDARDDGTFEDDAWGELNPESFRYGGRECHGRSWINEEGFLSAYSMSDVAEDKAELFSFMMTKYSAVIERSKIDLHIARKIGRLKSKLNNFDKSFNDRFWKQVERRERGLPGSP